MKRWAALAVLALACGGEPTIDDDAPECGCESSLDDSVSFDAKLSELTELSCQIGGPAVRGGCSDGKTFLYVNGGFGHSAFYFADDALIGSSSSSDIVAGCSTAHYAGDAACEIASVEPLCPSNASADQPITIPFADGQLSPWCDATQ
jgi:hypothetical protein